MKQSLIWVLLLVVVLGALAWFLTHETAEAPTTVEQGDPADGPTAERSGSETSGDYIGLTETAAAARADENGVPFRVVERDGEMLPTTRDYRPGRINAEVNNGVVTSYMVEGQASTDETPGSRAASGTNPASDPNANKYDFPTPIANGEDDGEDGSGGEHDAIIGMTEAEATAYAEANDVPFRIGSIDGESRPLTMDYRPGRITAALEDGVVTSYSVE